MKTKIIKIGTRGSKLAFTQAEYVQNYLQKAYPDYQFELVIIQTKGDKIQDKPLNQIGDKGLFVKEIEQELLENHIQMAVHSMKDMPAKLPEGLCFSKFWKREDARDVFLLREKKSLSELPQGAIIGTGSARRRLQLKKLRPDIRVVDIRGNVDTRIRKMHEQKLDGIILAAAGLNRLNMQEKITGYFEISEMIPAAAQGILALEVQKDNQELLSMLDCLSDEETMLCGSAERLFLEEMGGDCHFPVGAYCVAESVEDTKFKKKKTVLHMYAVYGRSESELPVTAEVAADTPEKAAKLAAAQIRKKISSTVYLIGAGPGDSGLITVKGMELLKKADCLVYDRLASPELLQAVSVNCEKIYVGKENHHHTLTQEEINQLLIKKSMTHHCVVRLKGGDPYVFGRGGEEALALSEAGVSVEVVPGVTSAIAGLSYAGIPITHRGISGGFRVLTAHDRRDELAKFDFRELAREKNTLVFLMGLSKLSEIVTGLINADMPIDTPIAVISCATTEQQKTAASVLYDIVEKVEQEKLISPALIVIGKVVSLRGKLPICEHQTEKEERKKKILLPKIGKTPSPLAENLRSLGADVTEISVGEIQMLSQKLDKEQFVSIEWLLFTSRHGVLGFLENLRKNHLDIRRFASCKIAVIGKKTAEALETVGIFADFIPSKADSPTLCKEFPEYLKQKNINKTIKMLYLNGKPEEKEMDDSIALALSDSCEVIFMQVYENKKINIKEKIVEKTYDGIIFTCASSAERLIEFVKAPPEDLLAEDGKIFSIGVKCTEKLQQLGVDMEKVRTAKESSYRGVEWECRAEWFK